MAVTTHCLVNDPVGTGELRANTSFPGGGAVVLPTGGKRGIVTLLHGLNGSTAPPLPLTDGPSLLYLTLANGLAADGWVVIFPVELGDTYGAAGQIAGVGADFFNDTGHGSRLLRNTLNWWDGALISMNGLFAGSAAWPQVPVGVSWGGWHALQLAIGRTSTIAAYCAQVAAMLPWTIANGALYFGTPQLTYTLASSENGLTLPQTTLQVNEDISGANPGPASLCVASSVSGQIVTYTSLDTVNKKFLGLTGGNTANGTMATGGSVLQSGFTSGADVAYAGLNSLGNGQQGAAPPGFIGWETGDTVVGWSNQQLLFNDANGAGQPVTSHAVTGGGHQLSSADVTAILAWFTATVDPLCPAVH